MIPVPVFVLAGGKGDRFKPYTDIIPKCLIPVAGKPCVRHIVETLFEQGFEDITLCVNEKDLPLFEHEFRDLNVGFSASRRPFGTAGELVKAFNASIWEDHPAIMVIYGDDLTFRDYRELFKFHGEMEGSASLALTDNFRIPVGGVTYEKIGLLVKRFEEKPSIKDPIWVGVAVFGPELAEFMRFDTDLAKDVIPEMLEEGYGIYAYVVHDQWMDVGSLQHWKETDKVLRNKNDQS